MFLLSKLFQTDTTFFSFSFILKIVCSLIIFFPWKEKEEKWTARKVQLKRTAIDLPIFKIISTYTW